MRARGTLFTHYKVAKPSLRVKFPKDRFFRGSRVTNLIIPYDQARVIGDTSVSALARRYGMITIPTRFVNLRLNGEVLGVYHEVEHFRKELAVKQFRSEGYFMSSLGEPKGGAAAEDHPGFARALEAFSACVTTRCSGEPARHVLDTFVDFDKMATYAAITTLFGAKHGWGEDNLILFFDPPRGRFEPIPWDMGTLRLGRGEDPFVGLESVKGIGSAFLRFDDFRRLRNQYVWDILQRHHDTALLESERLWGDIRGALAYDTEHSRRYTQRMVDYFQGALKHNFKLLAGASRSHGHRGAAAGDGLVVINHAAAGVSVEGPSLPRVVVPGRYQDQPGQVVLEGVVPDVPLSWHNDITGAPVPAEAIRWTDGEGELSGPELGPASQEPPGRRPPQGIRSIGEPGAATWVFSGAVRLDETLSIPRGIDVRFEPGLNLVLGPDVSLIIHGDLSSIGTEAAPIRVGGASLETPFGVVAILGTSDHKARVRLEHTTLYGGTEAVHEGSYFTGMFSVYDGHLIMTDSRIEDVLGEDGLNVKFGFIEARDNVIERTFSDAVDLDFCRGVLERNTVRGAGGDSLDFSGSLILARDNLLENTTDKGVSAGRGHHGPVGGKPDAWGYHGRGVQRRLMGRG